MPVSGPDVLVVGAGVSGLTTAVCLAEAGHGVEIRTDRLPPDTTSAVAGAIWGPYLVETGERATRWRRATLAVLRELAAAPGSEGTGVRIVEGMQIFRGPPGPPPDWISDLGGYRPCGPAELPPGFGTGWRYAAPLAHMPTYLGYLRARFERARGRLGVGTVASLAGAAREGGARVLFPHGEEVILGGSEAAGDWNLEPVPAIADRILRDCSAIEPRLRGTRVLAHRVGLRPARPTVRLEAEPGDGGPLIVHNYGHGGGGITLSWGCAREAAALAADGLR